MKAQKLPLLITTEPTATWTVNLEVKAEDDQFPHGQDEDLQDSLRSGAAVTKV